jgi:predicted DNA-binding protein
MNKVIRFNNIDVDTIPEKLLDEIEEFMIACFNKERIRKGDDTPIFKLKEYSISEIAKKYNLTIEKAKDIVREIQLRKLDRDFG